MWYKFYYSSCSALGIEAASFASGIRERGAGNGEREQDTGFGDGCGGASKDIAESPTALPERPH